MTKKYCGVPWCNNKHYAKGYCTKHYKQVERLGKILPRIKPNKCIIDNCNRKRYRGEFCVNHAPLIRKQTQFILDGNVCYIHIFDNSGQLKVIGIIDNDDFNKVIGKQWHESHGYIVANKHVFLHNVILNRTPKQGEHADHINRNPLDNRKANLRICTPNQNFCNRPGVKGSSNYKGVAWHKATGKWRAYIQLDKQHEYLGYFDKEKDAALAYNEAAKRIHGEFAHLNTDRRLLWNGMVK